jgi:hypothetical protein
VEIRLVQGRVVWAKVPDPQGRNPKTRRCIVISAGPFDSSRRIELVPATTTIDGAFPDEYVELQYGPGALTTFDKKCAAHCISVLDMPTEVIEEISKGIVAPRYVKDIVRRIAALGNRVVRQSHPFGE